MNEDVEAFRKEMSDRLIAIADKAVSSYCASIIDGNIQESKKNMKIIHIMEEASLRMKEAPMEELVTMLKCYTDQLDGL